MAVEQSLKVSLKNLNYGGKRMKKSITLIIVLSLFLNLFASVTLIRQDEYGNVLETKMISDSSGNSIQVNTMYMESNGYFVGKMEVIGKDGSIENFISYTDNYEFYTKKMNYFKYEKPLLYKSLKYTTIAVITLGSAYIAGPIIGSHIGIAGAFGAIDGSVPFFIIGGAGSFLGTVAIDNFIQNHKKGEWVIVKAQK